MSDGRKFHTKNQQIFGAIIKQISRYDYAARGTCITLVTNIEAYGDDCEYHELFPVKLRIIKEHGFFLLGQLQRKSV